MNVQKVSVTPEAALMALREYKQHRDLYDKRDWEIERIYRQISKGKIVIAALEAIRRAGLDDQGRPRLAIMRADQEVVICDRHHSEKIVLRNNQRSHSSKWYFEIPWPDRARTPWDYRTAQARLPRIPPQHRPAVGTLSSYHLLWEADWQDIPRDPYLLKRIGKDAWVVLAAWQLTEVEMMVLRAHNLSH